ncbi:hypothetical protein [Olleya marilimosa]|uniref:Uncharacterized protein n=1 Tax=Olleya marilimosa TaxID=272164 RepID=A0ABR8M1Z6_9FLAO|nr:hypothetical protein [Olleya marilimosa]MBD3864548.1 hypothetical protein [Olleya marilimosa]MBD3892028.1 hypothetical protein [Olleya marilimosa]
MKSKWYFGIVITALTFFVVSQQQITVPNQEIVFQFSDNQATVSQTEKAIHAVKAQLQNIGVKNTQVFEQNGILKISYYSDITIAEVKSILLNEKLIFNNTKGTQNDNPLDSSYNVDVFEIKPATESGVGFDGKIIVEAKQEYTRASQIVLSFSAITEGIIQLTLPVNVTHKVNTKISISIDKGSFNIPEGRAGPKA